MGLAHLFQVSVAANYFALAFIRLNVVLHLSSLCPSLSSLCPPFVLPLSLVFPLSSLCPSFVFPLSSPCPPLVFPLFSLCPPFVLPLSSVFVAVIFGDVIFLSFCSPRMR